MFKTIGVGAQLANGKDELSNYLVTKLNELSTASWKRNAFANRVKETFESAFGKDREFVEKWKREESPPLGFSKTIRQCLISIGDGFRQMQPNIWIEQAFTKQDSHQVISDCRYINETDFIRNHGGLTILLWRKGYENNIDNPSEQEFMPFVKKCLSTRAWTDGQDSWKPFEGEIGPGLEIPFDLFIRNEGTLDDLKRKVNEIVIPFVRFKWGKVFKD